MCCLVDSGPYDWLSTKRVQPWSSTCFFMPALLKLRKFTHHIIKVFCIWLWQEENWNDSIIKLRKISQMEGHRRPAILCIEKHCNQGFFIAIILHVLPCWDWPIWLAQHKTKFDLEVQPALFMHSLQKLRQFAHHVIKTFASGCDEERIKTAPALSYEK